jgi:FkbM family methyltransferase
MKRLKIQDSYFDFAGHPDGYLEHLEKRGEPSLEAYAKQFIPADSTIIDIGANIGYVSALFSVYNPTATIFAIEPGEKNFGYLNENVKHNDFNNILTRNFAVGASDYSTGFEENSAWGFLNLSDGSTRRPGQNATQVKSIDSFVFEEKIQKIDLIKIDVEGFEKFVIDGMLETIKKFSPKIIFELNSFCMIAYARTDPYHFLELIDDLFENKFILSKDLETSELLTAIPKEGFIRNALHSNIVTSGSVEDYLVY